MNSIFTASANVSRSRPSTLQPAIYFMAGSATAACRAEHVNRLIWKIASSGWRTLRGRRCGW